MSQATPWAILLTKWADNNNEPAPRSFFESLFTIAGQGSFNMTDYFDTMSHSSVDLSGNAIFGWFTLDQPQTTYVGNAPVGPGQVGRNELLALAKAKALAGGVDLSKYYGVVVVMNTPTDLCGWIGGRAALCDRGSCQPTVLGQEMGHGYGLLHSRVDGSTADYQDPWDTMSTWDSCFYTGDPNYALIGPGLNASNMRNMGWLDETRVWKPSSSAFAVQVELRPLHARSLPGHLAIELPGTPGGFLVEFRVPEDWDLAFQRPAVFVHRLESSVSYRMIGSRGTSDLVEGDSFTAGIDNPFSSYTTLHVDEINRARHYAKVSVSYRPRTHIHIPEIVATLFGPVAVDGGGIAWVNGHPHPVDPWGPLKNILPQLLTHQQADTIVDPIARLEAKRSALASIVESASRALGEITELETPPAQTRRPNVMRTARAARRTATSGKRQRKPVRG